MALRHTRTVAGIPLDRLYCLTDGSLVFGFDSQGGERLLRATKRGTPSGAFVGTIDDVTAQREIMLDTGAWPLFTPGAKVAPVPR